MLFQRTKAIDVSPREAAQRWRRGEIDLIDVREPAEWRQGHISGARHVPLRDLAAHLPEMRHRPTAFICAAGGRSAVAAELAAAQDVSALNVVGGVAGWSREGLPLVAGDPS